jgi:GTP-binding protein HflX
VPDRPAADPATLIGHGKVQEVKAWAEMEKAGCVLFDQSISPTQQRNLEREIPCRVIDRTQLILDIFAKHARTREGQLQVELAQLTYLLPRLTGKGAELSRLGGGIGTRGPGETKLETDRRRIGTRIQKLKRDLEVVRKTREIQRKKRSGVPLATVALAGYTNAGKSTLFNALTHAAVLADAKMFATLDPTIRVLGLPSRRGALLSDTVGFIRNLPPDLIQAFRATLEEVTRAAVIVHVIDLSSPHRREQMIQVEKVLDELDASEKPHILALNKIDLVEGMEATAAIEAERSAKPSVEVVGVSAKTGDGMTELLAAIDRLLPGDPLVSARFRFSHEEGDRLSFLYEHARVLERKDAEGGVEVLAEAAQSVYDRLQENVIAQADGLEA